eukprot:2264667-Pyramimonas_sp.AAC.1
MVVDTFHLFPETMSFLKEVEKAYDFEAVVFQAKGCADKSEYDAKHGADLWKIDVEEYDRICKVEPFQRGLKETGAHSAASGAMHRYRSSAETPQIQHLCFTETHRGMSFFAGCNVMLNGRTRWQGMER